jgi:hypothetical protein
MKKQAQRKERRHANKDTCLPIIPATYSTHSEHVVSQLFIISKEYNKDGYGGSKIAFMAMAKGNVE